MKTLYLDIFSGISGDMFLGAMLDLGVDFHQLETELQKLGIREYHLHASRSTKAGIEGIKFDVHLEHAHEHHSHGPEHDHEHVHADGTRHSHPHHHLHAHSHGSAHNLHAHIHEHEHEHEHGRTYAVIRDFIQGSSLSGWVKEKATRVFHRIAVAEGKIHGHPADEVHFHEVGAVDSIVDVVGACIALELLGKPRVLAAPVVEGTGWVNCAHGRFPVPTLATLEILGARGIALTQCEEPHELVTPTGAAILAEFVEEFAPMKGLVPARVGYGLGTRDNRTRPNVLRAVLGESRDVSAAAAHDWETDSVAVLETNIDDINAEVLGHFVEKALASGALDVFHTPIQMKKNRPGVLLSVLCAPGDADRFIELMLSQTSAFGVRRTVAERRKLRRETKQVSTPFGHVAVKFGSLDGRVVQAAPEFESCREAAERAGVPLKDVYAAAIRAAAS